MRYIDIHIDLHNMNMHLWHCIIRQFKLKIHDTRRPHGDPRLGNESKVEPRSRTTGRTSRIT